MKLFSLLFLMSIFSFAQEVDTINLKEVALVDYSKYKQFRPKYKKIQTITNNLKNGFQVYSGFQLPKQSEVEIVAIEILFSPKALNKELCGDFFYLKLKVVKAKKPNISIIEDKWFEVDKDYQGKYIFPVNLKIKSSEINKYLLALQSNNDDNFCQENYSYFDILTFKKGWRVKAYPLRDDIELVNTEFFEKYSLNYIIYYK